MLQVGKNEVRNMTNSIDELELVPVLSRLRNQIIELRNTKEQVRFIYETFPQAINSDQVLYYIYATLVHNFEPSSSIAYYFKWLSQNHKSLCSVDRSGRYWRSIKSPKRYLRDEKVVEQTLIKEKAYREVFK